MIFLYLVLLASWDIQKSCGMGDGFVWDENAQYRAHSEHPCLPTPTLTAGSSPLIIVTMKCLHVFLKNDSTYCSKHPLGNGSVPTENPRINKEKWRDWKYIWTWRKFPFLQLSSYHREWANERYLTKTVKLLIRRLFFENLLCFVFYCFVSLFLKSVDHMKMLKLLKFNFENRFHFLM